MELRIASWNMEGRWSARHAALIEQLDADVLLLTEVHRDLDPVSLGFHHSTPMMRPHKWWAAIASPRPMAALPDPHPASVAADVDGVTFVCSILPWRGASGEPWQGSAHGERTETAVAALTGVLERRPLVWGGDWNHAMSGLESAGSRRGRRSIQSALDHAGLAVPTADLPHRIEGLLSIDHIAVPQEWTLLDAERVDATGLSDHDAYAVHVRLPHSVETG
ncbi:MAG: endonuclease/exonuclease/phosphatase family protein [Jatrophihabitans sp.]|uniref:endonuclease/exonuclease/phosphatase family protein n=1 Tax=Jatrophihabitans sp. TaxID=1932789 RepID=UPI003F7DBF3A